MLNYFNRELTVINKYMFRSYPKTVIIGVCL